MDGTNFWQYQARLARRLMIWGAASMAAGLVFMLSPGKFWRGLGQQFFLWGLIDAVIAWFGQRGSQQRMNRAVSDMPAEQAASQSGKDASMLQNLLAVNTGLDMFYILGGALTVRKRGKMDSFWLGTGWGIIIQGFFLYLFDLIHAVVISRQYTRRR